MIVTDTSRDGLFAQFVTGEGSPALTAELVGNEFLPADERLGPLQMGDLRERGWSEGDAGNWTRDYPDASTDAARSQIALDALGAMRDVYGASGDVNVEVSIEGPHQSTELVQGRARIALLVGVALGLLAFVGALIYSVATPP